MLRPYHVRRVLTMLFIGVLLMVAALSGCASIGGAPTATPLPFDRFSAQQMFEAFQAAGLSVQNAQSNTAAGRGAPLTFNERYTFEIARIAPGGGQVVIFRTPEDLQAWLDYIATLRNDPQQRRNVVYVYTNSNALLQLNADLTNQEAEAFRSVFLAVQ